MVIIDENDMKNSTNINDYIIRQNIYNKNHLTG